MYTWSSVSGIRKLERFLKPGRLESKTDVKIEFADKPGDVYYVRKFNETTGKMEYHERVVPA